MNFRRENREFWSDIEDYFFIFRLGRVAQKAAQCATRFLGQECMSYAARREMIPGSCVRNLPKIDGRRERNSANAHHKGFALRQE